ncbi:MAG: DUF58 domain-containing protein [Prochlorothrix sp.]|nr:DUF58 domain-containing protein [Prochlorothrix sp.]
MLSNWSDWLERRWVRPAYGRVVLGGLSVFFFIAATNTLAGWLYVMSGLGVALLGLSAVLARQSVKALALQRLPIDPVSAGDDLVVTLRLKNPDRESRSLLLLRDPLPPELAPGRTAVPAQAIAHLPPRSLHTWTYTWPTQRRGIYRWPGVELRSGAPLGLCWYRRTVALPGRAIVYPTVLTLSRCPLLDQLGAERDPRFQSQQRPRAATEGVTRTLRPYRWGDSMRLIHWRTSARYGELRVRELEVFQGGTAVVLALDTGAAWAERTERGEAAFEEAIVAVASLYFYARRHSMPVQFWSGETGVVQGDRSVLEVLAGLQPQTGGTQEPLPDRPLLWLTANAQSLTTLPEGSRWVLWSAGGAVPLGARQLPGLVLAGDGPLVEQLQR